MNRSNRNGYVYLMANRRNGYTKIGFSKNPTCREKTLQSEEPQVEILATHFSDVREEVTWHKIFSHLRLRGEWFNLAVGDIEFIIELWKEGPQLPLFIEPMEGEF